MVAGTGKQEGKFSVEEGEDVRSTCKDEWEDRGVLDRTSKNNIRGKHKHKWKDFALTL